MEGDYFYYYFKKVWRMCEAFWLMPNTVGSGESPFHHRLRADAFCTSTITGCPHPPKQGCTPPHKCTKIFALVAVATWLPPGVVFISTVIYLASQSKCKCADFHNYWLITLPCDAYHANTESHNQGPEMELVCLYALHFSSQCELKASDYPFGGETCMLQMKILKMYLFEFTGSWQWTLRESQQLKHNSCWHIMSWIWVWITLSESILNSWRNTPISLSLVGWPQFFLKNS